MSSATQVKILSQFPTYQRCVQAPTLPFLAIRDEYLALANGDPCAAALLAYFEHLTNLRVRELQASVAPQGSIAQLFAEHGDMLWMTKSLGDLREALRGIWSEIRIRTALKLLQELGFVEKRHEEKSLDRRSRWRFLHTIVQSAIDAIFRSDASDRGIRCIESTDQVQSPEDETCIESGDQMIYRQDSYIQESSLKIQEQAPTPHAPAREGVLVVKDVFTGFNVQEQSGVSELKTTNLRADSPFSPSSAAPLFPVGDLAQEMSKATGGGLAVRDAEMLVVCYGISVCREALRHLQRMTGIHNPAGWLRAKITSWSSPPTAAASAVDDVGLIGHYQALATANELPW